MCTAIEAVVRKIERQIAGDRLLTIVIKSLCGPGAAPLSCQQANWLVLITSLTAGIVTGDSLMVMHTCTPAVIGNIKGKFVNFGVQGGTVLYPIARCTRARSIGAGLYSNKTWFCCDKSFSCYWSGLRPLIRLVDGALGHTIS